MKTGFASSLRLWVGLSMASLASTAHSSPLDQLPLSEELVLADRLVQVHNRQAQAAAACDPERKVFSVRERSDLARLLFIHDRSGTHSSLDGTRSFNIFALSRIQERQHLLERCAPISTFEDELATLSPRNPLSMGKTMATLCVSSGDRKKCFSEVAQMDAQLAPHCFHAERANVEDVKENYACMAGDKPLATSLSALGNSRTSALLLLSSEWLTRVRIAETGGSIELLEGFQSAMRRVPHNGVGEERRLFLAMLSALGTSGNSGKAGYIQSLEDRWLISDILNRLSPNQIHANYREMQAAKTAFSRFRKHAESRKIDLKILGRSVTGWNRHNFMAAYLACDFSRRFTPSLAEAYVTRIGLGYEGLDFVSHLLSGSAFRNSVGNFKTDTERYRVSSRFGREFCAVQ